MDSRYLQLARTLTGHSLDLRLGDKVQIDAFDVPDTIVLALIREVRARGAIPFVRLAHAKINRELLLGATDEQYEVESNRELVAIKEMDAYIGLRGSNNIFESADVPTDKTRLASSYLKPAWDWRVNKTRWVVLRWPTSAMAQQATRSTEAFEDFYFQVCTLDYGRMAEGMDALRDRMESTDIVHIEGPGTDIKFSIKGIGAVPCGGHRNIPDGEVFTCPIRDSVQGAITYNAPTVYQGVNFDNIRLVFRDGRIVEASCSGNQRKLEEILDTDDGSRYVGEFAIGFNPHILEPMRDILFDEKIAGSFHLTPGQAYEGLADNGNRSQVHWDMVCIQRPEYGGGTIRFDGELIREDGLFLPDPLKKLNPEYLLGGSD